MGRIKSIVKWFVNTPLARSLRFRLISLVLLASLPTIALLFLTASQARTGALVAAEQEANRIATLTANEQAHEIDRAQREISLLSRLPEVRSNDSAACTSFFQSLVLSRENPMYVDLRVVGLDGSTRCRSGISNPLGQNEDRTFIDTAIRQQHFTVGDYRINPLNGRSILSLAAPITNTDGSIDRAIVATLDLEQQTSSLERTSMPDGSSISLVRYDGTLLLQEPANLQVLPGTSLIGTPIVDEIAASNPLADLPQEDQQMIVAAAQIAFTADQPTQRPAFVVVEIPRAEVVKRANTAFRDNLAKIGVSTAIAVLAAWIGADLFISRDSETRKTIVSELYHSFGTGVVDHLDTIVAENVVDHAATSTQAKGLDGIKQTIAAFRYAFPDGEVVPRELLADREKVMTRVSLTGTMVGEFQGIPPTGVRMIADGIETFAFRDGLISETWSLMGPLLEMEIVEEPENIQVEPAPRRRSLWERLHFGRKGKGSPA